MSGDWRRWKMREPGPLDRWEILAEEFENGEGHPLLPDEPIGRLAAECIAKNGEDGTKEGVERALLRYLNSRERTALCFSGGGVRSATFGLGVLQGLATCNFGWTSAPLAEFDFLSTVSGGGYVGSWFTAWATRTGGPANVIAELAAPRSGLEPEPEPLLHIRRYAAFLTPKLGLLSADAWTLAATIARNMILNWLILVPLFMAVLLVPSLFLSLLDQHESLSQPFLVLGGAAIMLGAAYITYHLPSFGRLNERKKKRMNQAGDAAFVVGSLLPLTLGAMALALHWAWRLPTPISNYSPLRFALYGALFHTGGWVSGIALLFLRNKLTAQAKTPGAMILGPVAAFLSGMLAGWLTYLVSTRFEGRLAEPMIGKIYVCVAVPVILGAFLIAALLAVGMASKITGDEDREWWSRAGGWVMIVGFGWLALSASVLLAPHWVPSASRWIYSSIATAGVGGVASWFGFSASTPAGQGSAKSSKTQDSSAASSSLIKDAIAKLAAPVFLLMLTVVLAAANQRIVVHLGRRISWLRDGDELWLKLGLLAACLLLAAISSSFINVNRFSLHAMYRARLIRTYLGASNVGRKDTVNRFTNLDAKDNFSMSTLSGQRPLHIVNMALNLVGGHNLAWQQRKAESFTASRLRTGCLRVGYQPTAKYASDKGGLTIGSAVAISGAAASPNMGYHSSPLVTLIMTLFNARLGWWLANPGKQGKGRWTKEGPSLAFLPIINEALGRTSDESSWIYLSDGGHFENLGVYEMVLRRCGTIVVVDGSEDHSYSFEDLGNAIRKVRVDLGISIEFENGIPIYAASDPRNRYCGIGCIRYDPAHREADGALIYIKACLNGSEPRDVLNYAAEEPAFPQQGTEELWFNESQFESYRRLGLHIAQRISAAVLPPESPALSSAIDGIVKRAQRYSQSPNA